ncbi:MAG TPA: hypothetical protein VL176_05115 [Steroidobacteraceae bacterium]|nr:hypothetical protein [Steroidobacteraceae bacterium]
MKPTPRRVAVLFGCLLCVVGCRAQTSNAATLPAATERESIPGTDVSYAEAAVDDGDRVRLIVT